jgi:hypothetical protein
MRGLIALNILARREDTSVFVPVNSIDDPGGKLVAAALEQLT